MTLHFTSMNILLMRLLWALKVFLLVTVGLLRCLTAHFTSLLFARAIEKNDVCVCLISSKRMLIRLNGGGGGCMKPDMRAGFWGRVASCLPTS